LIADLHAHYPMHLTPRAGTSYLELVQSRSGRWRLLDLIRAGLVRFASRLGNYRSFVSGPRVTVPLMREGGVGVALSVLYSSFDEMDLTLRYGSPPQPHYHDTLVRQLEDVESEVATHDGARIVRNPAELEAALAAGELAIVHCVEGAFHLDPDPATAGEQVAELARRGVAYITVAHLFWRSVATNVNAIPFLPDFIYNLLFPQPDVGLTPLGSAIVEAMVRERVLIDLSHMSDRALDATFDLLDRLDPAREVPVLATHVAYRFGHQDYNLDEPTVRRIAERGGLIGLILSEHQGADGLGHPRSAQDSIALLCRHIDRLHEITGSHRHTGIGTDFDGFIKPTLKGLEDAGDLAALERALAERYGPEDGELIASGNALRLLRGYWRGSVAPADGEPGS
jgi:microsomal dipeptidase-like Zn-dependent dipeptidase